MAMFEKMPMKAALKRLEQAGVAPRGETPIDFDTAAVPGRAAASRGVV